MPNYIKMTDDELEAVLAAEGTAAPSWNGAVAEYNRRAQQRVAEATEATAKATLDQTTQLVAFTARLVLVTWILGISTLALVWVTVFEDAERVAKVLIALGATISVFIAIRRL